MGCILKDSITSQKIMRNKNSQFSTEMGNSSFIFITENDMSGNKSIALLNIFWGIIDILPHVCYNMDSKCI